MPKSKVNNIVSIDPQESLLDARGIAAQLGFTAQYINRMAAAGKIPWHGMRNGAKVYRRYDLLAVKAALAHEAQSA